MNNASKNNTTNRYPGVKPFSISEKFMFFGREADVEALNSLIFVNQTVVLYGKSGYGKSSLINAGIIPELQCNQEWVYFSIRFNNFSEKEAEKNLPPSQTARQRLSENLKIEKNNLLDSLIPNENSFWYWIKQNQLHKSKEKFIVFFDQFEELFTYPKDQINDFSEQLSQLLYTTLPVSFKRRLTDFENSNELTDAQHDFLYDKPDVKVIFSIRSDRLSLLNLLKEKHPSILQKSYELDALDIKDARSAIIEPARLPQELGFLTPDFSFTEGAVDKIISSIADPQEGKIETATLQIICRFVEESLVASKRLSVITESDLGDFTDIFQQYYEDILNRLSDVERPKAQYLIEDELINGNRRNPLSATYINNKFGLSDSLLLQLEQSSLLRKERDASGRILYEVSHDSLVSAIERVAKTRRQVEENLKKTSLEKQVMEERKRAQELEALNKKAVFRYKLAIGLVVISLLIASTAYYFYRVSDTAEKEAKRQEKIAKENANEAVMAKNKAEKTLKDLKKANDIADYNRLFEAANGLLNDPDRACQIYKMAYSILANYDEEKDKMNELKNKIKEVCDQ